MILGALFLSFPAPTPITSSRIGGRAEPRSSKRSLLAALVERLPDLASLSGRVRRNGRAAALALAAILIFLSPMAAKAADGDGCNYLKNNPSSFDNGAYVITGSLVTRPAPPGNQTDIINYASGTVLYYSYTVSDPSITARLTYSGLNGLGIDIVSNTSTDGSGSFTLPIDSRTVTPSGTIPNGGPGGTVTWTVYCGVRATQAAASTTGTVGVAMSFTPVTASFGRGTYTYALSGGTLPAGLSFNTGTGAVTGTPTAALAATTFTVTVTGQGGGSSSQTFQLTVNAAVPTVSAVSPVSGPTGGGNAVTITGTGFSTANATGAVLFGPTTATYTINSDTQITATVPTGTAGTVHVTVTTPGGTSATSTADNYTYVAAPTVTAISPNSGPTGGGTPATITGSGFLAAASTGAVKFGGSVATYTINSDTQITATAPSGSGTVDVTVTTPGGTSVISAADQFTYVAAPTVTSISPTAGPIAGGTSVTVTGSGFLAAAPTGAVKFGANVANYTIITDTQIAATAPAGPAGTVDVTVTTAGGTTTTSAADQFTYAAVPTVTSISPTAGPIAGGTAVTLTGTNLSGATLTADGASVTPTGNTATTVSFTTPAHAPGAVSVMVTTVGGSASTSYTYVAAPTIGTLLPTSGPTSGGTSVTLTGTNLSGATLTVDGVSVTPTSANATTVTFTSPAHAAGAVNVVVTTPGGSDSTSFTYVAAPVGSSFTASAVAYDATGVTFSVAGHATNSPTSYAVGSITTAFGGSVSINSAGLATYDAPTSFRGNDSFTFTATNPGGTSSPATVTVPVSNPTLASTLTGGGTNGTALSGVQISTSGGRAPYSCATTLASGALPAGTQINPDCSISGTPAASNTFTFTAIVTDSSLGTGPFTQTTGSLTLNIAAGAQTISFGPLSNISLSSTPPPLSATASSGLTVSFASTTPAVCTVSGTTVTLVDRGLCSITASQAGDADWSAASNVVQSFTVTPATLVVTSSAVTGLQVGAAYSQANTASGGVAPYTYSLNAGAFVPGTSLNPVTGTVSGTPTVAGTFSYMVQVTDSQGPAVTATTPITTVMIAKGNQTISFTSTAPTGATAGGTPYTITAASNANLTVSYSRDGSSTGCDLAGNTVAFIGPGTCRINADQSGDINWNAAAQIQQSFVISQAAPALTVSASNATPALGASVTFTATLAGAAAPTGTITFKDGATTLGNATISGTTATFSTSALGVGAHVITAEYAGDANNAAATAAATTVTVGLATPTLAVSASNATPLLGASVTITATLAGGASPTGTVTFKDGSTVLGTGTVAGTTATFSTAALAVGAHAVTAEYGGDANNAAVTSAATTITVGKLTPTVTVSASDSALALGASVTFTATLAGGAAPTGTVTFKDGSTVLGTGTIAGTTATFSTTALAVGVHAVTAEYAGDANNAAVTSAAATVTVGKLSPTLTVSASDSAPALGASVTFTATLAGGAAPTGTVTFKDGSTVLGTGTIAGTTATFSTAALAVGAHAITAEYAGDANNAAVTSAAATVTVGKLSPTLTVSASDSAPAFGASVTFTAALAGGAAPTGTVTFKDGSTTLGTATISGTTATFSTTALAVGAHAVTAEYAGDANNAAATSAAATVTVKPAVAFTFSPAGGALKDAMAGEDYSQAISATGGTGALIYGLASGALPKGIRLLPTGELSGPLDADAEVRDYSFTIEVRDGSGATGTANYTITVKKRAVTVTDKNLDVPGGASPNNVNLEAGATGGPFTSANLVFVEPANAGTASIVLGEFAAVGPTPLVWYLKFVPDPAYSGTAKVGFTLTSALGVSNTGTVTYKLGYDAAKVTQEIDSLVHGFVRSRQSLVASAIKVPGLLERRRMANAIDPIAARMAPSESGLSGSFSSSLAQMEAARDNADGASGGYVPPFNIWIDSTFMLHNSEQDDKRKDNRWGSFAMLSLGADYLVSDKVLVGLSFHYDRMTDPTDEDAKLTGNGWLAGPYASFEIGKGVFWDTSLLYGSSANAIDTAFWDGSFDTRRWMIDTSVTGGWQLDEDTVLTPRLRALYFSERVNDYAVKNAAGDTVSLEGFDEEQFRVSLAAEVTRSFTLGNDMVLTPKLGVTGGFSGLDGSGAFGSISAGLSLQTGNAWMIDTGLLLNIEGDGQQSVGAKAGVSSRF